MFNVLVANSDLDQRESYCQYLSSTSKKLNIVSVSSGLQAINAYNEIDTCALVMDTQLSDLSGRQILDKLSSTKKESKVCNIVLTTNLDEPISTISNSEKVQKVLIKPFEYKELKDAVDHIRINYQLPDLDDPEFYIFLAKLGINSNKPNVQYLIEALHEYYYSVNFTENLDSVERKIGNKFNVPKKTIHSGLRNALKPLNEIRTAIPDSDFINLFNTTRNISPGYFLNTSKIYLRCKARKNKK